MSKSPLLAVMLIVSTVRGTNIAFHWPPSLRNSNHFDQVHDGRPMAHDDDDESNSLSDDYSDDCNSTSSEDSFNEDAARIGYEEEERLPRSSAGSRFVRDSSFSAMGRMRSTAGSSRARSQTRPRTTASPDARENSGRSRSRSRAPPPYTFPSPSHTASNPKHEHGYHFASFAGFELGMLASILIPRTQQCHQRFEMTIDDLTFLGHPVAEEHQPSHAKHAETSIFNLVFVFDRLNMFPSIRFVETQHWLQLYYTIIFKLTAVLAMEEARAKYVSEESYKLIQIREDALQEGSSIEECTKFCLEESTLATILRDVYRCVKKNHDLEVNINNRFRMILKIPPLLQQSNKAIKATELQPVYDIHDNIILRGDQPEPFDSTTLPLYQNAPLRSVLQEWSQSTGPFLLPWKTLLLPEDVFDPVLSRYTKSEIQNLVNMFDPSPSGFKTFAETADLLQWDLYKNVYPLIRHLIYYKSAQVIDVPRLHNLYTIHPLFDAEDLPTLNDKWQQKFPRMVPLNKFVTTLSSSLRPFASHCRALGAGSAAFNMLVWLLREKVIAQTHVYLRLFITERDQLRAVELRKNRRERQLRFPSHHADVTSPERQAPSDRSHARVKLETPTSFVPEWPPNNKTSTIQSQKNVLAMDVEDDHVDDLLPQGKPCPVMIPEPARASRTESEWISALLHGRHSWYSYWLIRLFPYMNGMHSVDEMVAREKIRRRDLKSLLTEFDANILHFYHP